MLPENQPTARRSSATLAALGLAIALLFGAILLLVANYNRHGDMPQSGLSSDDLFLVDMLQQVFQDRFRMTGCHFPYTPYVFPDMTLLLPGLLATRDVGIMFLVYALLFYGLLAAVVAWIAHEIGLKWRESGALGCGGVLFLLTAHLSHPDAYRTLMISHPANHVGAILVGLLLVAFVLHWLRGPIRRWPALLFVLACGLGTFSDKILIVQFLAPIALTLLLLAVLRWLPVAKLLGMGSLVALGFVMSLGLKWVLLRLGLIMLSIEEELSLARSVQACKLFAKQFPQIIRDQPVFLTVLPVYFLLATGLVIWCIFSRTPRSSATESTAPHRTGVLALAAITLLSCAGNVAAVLGTGLWTALAHERYVLVLFLLPPLFLGLLLRALPWQRASWASPAFACAVFLFAGTQGGFQMTAFHGRDLRQPYPELARAIDQLAREKHCHYGLAGFWYARYLTFLSRENVKVKATLQNGEPWLHSDNPNTYLSADPKDLTVPEFHFIVVSAVSRWPDPKHVRMQYGEPAEKRIVGTDEIWVYDPLTCRRFNAFLTGILAEKYRRTCRRTAPAQPYHLSLPKDNFTPWNDRKNVLLPRGQELEVRFAAPVTGPTLDFAADCHSAYRITFFRDQEQLGALVVGPATWTGLCTAYDRAGVRTIYSRLVTLPESVRNQGWDRAVIRCLQACGTSSIGHFLVYDEPLPDLPQPPKKSLEHQRFEAEALNSAADPVGSILHDPSASGGQARLGKKGFSGALMFGPYASLDAGHYRVDIALKAPAPRGEGLLGGLDVTTLGGRQVLAHRELLDHDFASDESGYQIFSMDFEADYEIEDVEFRFISTGRSDLAIDYVDLRAVPPAAGPAPR